MTQKDQYMSCPKCGREISSYALICPHCTQRISQKDFGKTVRPAAEEDASLRQVPDHSVGNSMGNVVMLIVIAAAAVGIYARFQDQIRALWDAKRPLAVSMSREEFEELCRDGMARTMYFENQDTQKMHHLLEEYAQARGYPNRAALLQECAKATYHYLNGKGNEGHADEQETGEF